MGQETENELRNLQSILDKESKVVAKQDSLLQSIQENIN